MRDGELCLLLELARKDLTQTARLYCVSTKAVQFYEMTPDKVLHESELIYYNSSIVEKRRREYLMGRVAAKKAVQHFLPSRSMCEIEIRPGIFQQPIVCTEMDQPIEVCITHSGHLAAAVAYPTGHPLGLDLEKISHKNPETLHNQVDETELPPVGVTASVAEAYTRCWSVKEALSKILKCGLTVPFSILKLAPKWEEKAVAGQGCFLNFSQYAFLSLASNILTFSLVHPARTTVKFSQSELLAFMIDTEQPPHT